MAKQPENQPHPTAHGEKSQGKAKMNSAGIVISGEPYPIDTLNCESSHLGDDAGHFALGEWGEPIAWTTTWWHKILHRRHDKPAFWTVDLTVHFPIRKPTKQHAAIFNKVLGYRCILKLLAKICVFFIQSLYVLYKPFVFTLDMIQLVTEEQQSLAKNRSASMLSNEFVDHGGQAHSSNLNDEDEW